jgi:ATP-dependent protease ClpP protease subunit
MAEKKSVYFIFSALIDQLAVQRFFALTACAMQDGIEEIHLLMQSVGGNVGDGVCLYNFFRALPIEVSIYNCGHISSAGVTAYLGGDKPGATARQRPSVLDHLPAKYAQLVAGTRDQLFQQLYDLRLFREAWDRIQTDRKKSRQSKT